MIKVILLTIGGLCSATTILMQILHLPGRVEAKRGMSLAFVRMIVASATLTLLTGAYVAGWRSNVPLAVTVTVVILAISALDFIACGRQYLREERRSMTV